MSEVAPHVRPLAPRTTRVGLFSAWLGLALLLLCVPASHAGFDAFLRLEGVPGESTDAKHPGWIQVLAVTNGVEISPQLQRPVFRELMLWKRLDKASPVLDLACAQGQRFPLARLELVHTGGTRLRFYAINLTNVVVVRMDTAGRARTRDTKPSEIVHLHYEQIAWTYTEFDVAGVPQADLSAWWDILRNTGGRSITSYFRVSGIEKYKDSVILSWPGQAGKTYIIRSSDQVVGPYSILMEVPVAVDGPITQLLPIRSAAQFFTVEEGP